MAMRLLCIAALAVIMAPHVACRAVPLETGHTRALRQLGYAPAACALAKQARTVADSIKSTQYARVGTLQASGSCADVAHIIPEPTEPDSAAAVYGEGQLQAITTRSQWPMNWALVLQHQVCMWPHVHAGRSTRQ